MRCNRRIVLAGSALIASMQGEAAVTGKVAGETNAAAELAQKERIRKTVERYFELIDNGRSAELKQLFTPDGQLLIDGGDVFKGQVSQQRSLGMPPDPIVGYTHCLHQCNILLDGARAFGEVYATAYVMVEKERQRRMLVRSIRYFDRYVSVGQQWLFQTRHHHVHWMFEAPLTTAKSTSERDSFADFLASHGMPRT